MRPAALGVGVAAVLTLLLVPAAASAGTITVTTTADELNDAAPCSLREAIVSTNTDVDTGGCNDTGGADAINLPDGFYELSSTVVFDTEDAAQEGDLDITGPLTINGGGVGTTIVDGQADDEAVNINEERVFDVLDTTVKLTELAVVDGHEYREGGSGSGVRLLNRAAVSGNPALTLDRVLVSDNGGSNLSGSGGGISAVGDAPAARAGSLTLRNSVVRDNNAHVFGGGIEFGLNGSLNVSNSTIADNRGDAGSGGIHMARGTLSVTGSSLTRNQAGSGTPDGSSGPGGAIGGRPAGTIDGSTLSGNHAVADGGGAISLGAMTGSLTISDSTITDNGATEGGGVSLDAGAGPLTITGGTLTRNGAGDDGGAISLGADADPLTISDSVISRNSSGFNGVDHGGAIYDATSSLVTITASTLNGNSTFGDGGAIKSDGGLTTAQSTFERNYGDDGGAIKSDGGLTIEQSSFGENRGVNGAAIHSSGGLDISGSRLVDNFAPVRGGAIVAEGSGGFAISGTTLADNEADYAGAIYDFTSAPSSISDSTFRGNFASEASGGAIVASGTGVGSPTAALEIRRSSFVENSSFGRGGAIDREDGDLTLVDSSLRENAAGEEGGGIYNDGDLGVLTVTGSTLDRNRALTNGGAIYNSYNPDPAFDIRGVLNLANSTLSRNLASGEGGAIFNVGTTDINNATIYRNTTVSTDPSTGGGLKVADGSLQISNSILAANQPSECDGPVATRNYNIVQGSCPGLEARAGDQIGADPLLGPLNFNGGPTETHALIPGSPAINSGYPGSGLGELCEATDQRGVPRSLGGRCDIGAYERVSCLGGTVNVVGTDAPETINGTPGRDYVLGLAGDDQINGLDGNDSLCGGSGNDTLNGGPGTDRCDGASGTDTAVACETVRAIP